MVNIEEQNNKLKFSYESDAVASFLVIQYDAAVIDHQLRMLENNCVKYVLSPEMVMKEGLACFYYNITSKISLSFLLKRQKLSKEEFLRLLLNITSSVSDSTGYLLNPESFIFNTEYIYINPETLEPSLVYLPVKSGHIECGTLQGFISELLMMHIQAEGFDKGNFVQRILSVARSDVFSLKACAEVMRELMYKSEQSKGLTQYEEHVNKGGGYKEPKKVESITANNYIKVKKEEKEKEKQKRIEKNGSKSMGANVNTYLITVFVIALQFAMGSIIYVSRGFLEKIGENQTVTYAAVLMIVLAVDALIFKRIYDAKLIFVKQIRPKPEIEVQIQKSRADANEASVIDGRGYWSVAERSKALGGSAIGEHRAGRSGGDTGIRRPAVGGGSGSLAGNRIAAVGGGSESISIRDDRAVAIGGGSESISIRDDRAVAIGGGSGSREIACKTVLLGKDAKGTRVLRSTGKHGSDEDIMLDKEDLVIGRLEGHVDHVISNNAVGKLHAQVTIRNGSCFVKDLNSMNGTFINNTRLASNKEYELKDSDRLRLANCEFVMVHG